MRQAVPARAALPLGVLLVALATPALAASGSPAPVVFFDIAGPDMGRQAAFYHAVFGWEIGPAGLLAVPAAPTLAGALRSDPANKVIYLGVDDVTATMANVVANGGAVIKPRFQVPGVAVLGLFTDPAGNHMGLVEMLAGKPRIP
jgi:predicted enzyme related to lactoylglutathione lyase